MASTGPAETPNGRILYDVGCDHAKIADPLLRARHYDPAHSPFGAPQMTHEQRIPRHLARLGQPLPFVVREGEYTLTPGVRAIATPGHTAGHMSIWIELAAGPPVILCGDAADLQENLDDEVAPGGPWRNEHGEGEALALQSIRKLKRLAQQTGARLWPNHDMAFWRGLPPSVGLPR